MFKSALPAYILLLIILACATAYLTSSEGFESSPRSFFSNVTNKKVVVLLYNDNCGYCKDLKPIWDKVSEVVSDKVVAVNCSDSDNPDVQLILKKTNTNIFPRIFFMNGPKTIDYNGTRTVEEILKFVNDNVK
jgi:thiol-disulfide isomerase/thioredoxin